jgi:hypothetical protein
MKDDPFILFLLASWRFNIVPASLGVLAVQMLFLSASLRFSIVPASLGVSAVQILILFLLASWRFDYVLLLSAPRRFKY